MFPVQNVNYVSGCTTCLFAVAVAETETGAVPCTGYGLRVTGYGLRVTGYGLRVLGYMYGLLIVAAEAG